MRSRKRALGLLAAVVLALLIALTLALPLAAAAKQFVSNSDGTAPTGSETTSDFTVNGDLTVSGTSATVNGDDVVVSAQLKTFTVDTTDVTDGSTACNSGDGYLDTDGPSASGTPRLWWCIDGATDNWAYVDLTD